MRHDFRVKMDLSQIYQDARQLSWVYIDSSKIFYVSQLAEHVRKLFEIKRSFHFMSKFEEIHIFLPFEEDVRVLENNDSVIIVPGIGKSSEYEMKNEESPYKMQNSFIEPVNSKENEINVSSEKFYTCRNSSVHSNVENITDSLSLSDNLYTTAMHDTSMSDREMKAVDNFMEDNSLIKENIFWSKRKRIRKKKQKKLSDVDNNIDASIMKFSDKKPKIIDSVLISSGKHIRFKSLEDEDTGSVEENNIQWKKLNNDFINKESTPKNLTSLLNLRQSSTPLCFGYKKIKKELNSETINKKNKLMVESEGTTEISESDNTIRVDDTVSFRILRMGEDYTPLLSNVIVAKVLSYNKKELQYILKILHGKNQLEEPEGKFSLPKDEENTNNESNDIVTLEKSKLLDLTKITNSDNISLL